MKNTQKTKIIMNTTVAKKEEIQRISSSLNLTMTDYILSSLDDKKFIVEQTEKVNQNVLNSSSVLLTELTEMLSSIKEDTKEINSSFKPFVEINISSFKEIRQGDLLILKGNTIEVFENDLDENKLYVMNLVNNKKHQLSYEQLVDSIVKRRV